MVDRAREQRLQLLLSWRRKALEAGADTAFNRGRYPSFDDCRADHLRRAAEAITAFRAEVRVQMDKLATERFALLREQQALPGQVQRGKLTPVDANRRNRKMRQHIENCEAEMARYNVLIGAEDPVEAGGFIDLTLERYAQKAGVPVPGKKIPNSARLKAVFRAMNNNWVQAGAGLVGVIAAILAVLYCTNWSGSIEFAAGATYPPSHLRLVCENNTQQDATFYAPWADGRPHTGSGDIGVEVLIAGRGTSPTLFPTADLWTFQGATTLGKDPVKIRPGTRAEFMLDINILRARAGNGAMREVTLSCTTPRGWELFRYGYDDIPLNPPQQ